MSLMNKMITVTISINGKPIYTRSAVNISEIDVGPNQINSYKVDTGKTIKHLPRDGAVVLAKKMLDTIKEEKNEI